MSSQTMCLIVSILNQLIWIDVEISSKTPQYNSFNTPVPSFVATVHFN
jgi:hypothetical protein